MNSVTVIYGKTMFFCVIKHQKMKMKTKNLMVFFLAIVSMFALVATASAAEITDFSASSTTVKINGVEVLPSSTVGVIAGDTVSIRLYFNSLVDASNVRVKAEIDGDKVDVSDRTSTFVVENGGRYDATLTLDIPSELKDEVSDTLELSLKIWDSVADHKSEETINLKVQRPTYNADIKSVSFSQTVDAGESLPVDIVMKNYGYNDLDDLYVTVSISGLGLSKTAYFGDLVALENTSNDEETDTASGRIYVDVPYGAEAGIYDLQVSVSNDDITTNFAKQIVVNNDFAGEVIKNGEGLLIVNPTNKLKVYNVVFPESESYVTVSAGSSKTIDVNPSGDEYTVSVLSMNGEVVESFTFDSEGVGSVSNPVVVLTIILAIVFVVLLIVLIALIGKKPEKSEDFGESYY